MSQRRLNGGKGTSTSKISNSFATVLFGSQLKDARQSGKGEPKGSETNWGLGRSISPTKSAN